MIIGLTGGIASGKTTVSDIFHSFGVPVLDADEVSRQLTAPHGEALPAIALHFGPEYINEYGLDRARMRNLVFTNSASREKLESILHPLIKQKIFSELKKIHAPYIILSVPLLVEGGRWNEAVSRILVVDVPESVQLERLTRTRGLSPDIAQSIIHIQASRQGRLAVADDVIDNTLPLAELRKNVEALHRKYLRMASPENDQVC